MYADFAQHLIGIARPLYAEEPLAVDLDATVYAFDATTIDLCLSVYPWAPFRSAKAAIKLHTLLDRGYFDFGRLFTIHQAHVFLSPAPRAIPSSSDVIRIPTIAPIPSVACLAHISRYGPRQALCH
ncbi:MAG: hypothetical protein K2Y31_18070 [Burkholderiales bacterium]|jgi:hypothetical protein|nr:hypothetical protein [Burkholderiales bacterium]